MTEEQFNKAKDIRASINRLNALFGIVNDGASANSVKVGDLVRNLLEQGSFNTHFCEFIAKEMALLNDEFAKLGCDDGTNGDWTSVGFRLPPYEEDVLVCCADEVEQYGYWFSHRSENEELLRDDKQFTIMKPLPHITHWRHITPPKKR